VRLHIFPWLLAAATVCGVADAAAAAESVGKEAPPDRAPVVVMRAYVDPATGRLAVAPTTNGNWREPGPKAPDFGRMREERLPDGTVLLHPDGQFRMVSIVRRGPDGTLRSSCEPLPAGGQDEQ